MRCIFYKKGYKYQLTNEFYLRLNCRHTQSKDIYTKYIDFNMNGYLIIRSGYAWDGPSGPTYDSKNTMRGSLIHDALYQLIRDGLLPFDYWKKADDELYRICRLDGMSWIRARLWIRGLRLIGGSAAKPKNKKGILIAP